MEKSLKKTAEIISFILNPLVLAFCIILIGIDRSNLPQKQMIVFTILVLLFNGLAPIYFYLELLRRKIVFDDVLSNEKALKNRPMVLGWWMISFLMQGFLVRLLGIIDPLFNIFIILFILTFILFLISLSKKISLHMAYSTLFALMIIYIFSWSFWPILLIIPLIAWSRYYLMRHTAKQLLAGVLISSIVASSMYLLLTKF